jgi:threonine/homoserine/homoserine lactone efflux protein
VPEPLLGAAIRWESVGPLLLVSLAIMGSPGPATISLVATGSAYGLRRSLRYLLGIIVGSAAVLVAVATGVTAALLAVPLIGSLVRGLSATYIIWLAYQIATAPPLPRQGVASDAPTVAGGVLLGATNPKAWVAFAAVFASAHLAAAETLDAVAKTVVLATMIIVICSTWLLAGTSLAPVLQDPRRARVANTGFAVALVGATALTLLD